ncbi:hypothetical protein EXU30_04995 [Shewanella maritima]|uniref:Uncharacterized protein n=1 Tax=Shewanella maritima TaxID=2520507 RepID=A0A411PEZ9_9GAMM|nr:hypothetical protein [Shewanella maritima]QBF82131.1 hypothetical protein EXU30_04995 [Shewanella maritima]
MALSIKRSKTDCCKKITQETKSPNTKEKELGAKHEQCFAKLASRSPNISWHQRPAFLLSAVVVLSLMSMELTAAGLKQGPDLNIKPRHFNGLRVTAETPISQLALNFTQLNLNNKLDLRTPVELGQSCADKSLCLPLPWQNTVDQALLPLAAQLDFNHTSFDHFGDESVTPIYRQHRPHDNDTTQLQAYRPGASQAVFPKVLWRSEIASSPYNPDAALLMLAVKVPAAMLGKGLLQVSFNPRQISEYRLLGYNPVDYRLADDKSKSKGIDVSPVSVMMFELYLNTSYHGSSSRSQQKLSLDAMQLSSGNNLDDVQQTTEAARFTPQQASRLGMGCIDVNRFPNSIAYVSLKLENQPSSLPVELEPEYGLFTLGKPNNTLKPLKQRCSSQYRIAMPSQIRDIETASGYMQSFAAVAGLVQAFNHNPYMRSFDYAKLNTLAKAGAETNRSPSYQGVLQFIEQQQKPLQYLLLNHFQGRDYKVAN